MSRTKNMAARQKFVCACFYTRNYFIPQHSIHVNFIDHDQFVNDYEEVFVNKGCSSEDLSDIAQQLKSEKERRLSLGKAAAERKELIQRKYQRLHPHVFELQKNYLHEDFLSLTEETKQHTSNKDSLIKKMKVEKAKRVYSFPVFTKQFCDDLVEELIHFENSDLPKGRPNTMNNYGILLNELGFDDKLITPLRENYLNPLSKILYPEWTGEKLDSHKAFIVTYKMHEDLDLNYHFDNAEVTINVSLGKDFSEGSLYFGNMYDDTRQVNYTEVEHRATHGVLHRGRHKHGAMPISDGERYNLIIWMRSSSVRNQLCPMCGEKPDLVPTDGEGDGFTRENVNVCSLA